MTARVQLTANRARAAVRVYVERLQEVSAELDNVTLAAAEGRQEDAEQWAEDASRHLSAVIGHAREIEPLIAEIARASG